MYRAVMKTPFGDHYGKNRKRYAHAQDDLCEEIKSFLGVQEWKFILENTVVDDGIIKVNGVEFWIEKHGYRDQTLELVGTTAQQRGVRSGVRLRGGRTNILRPHHPD